MNDDTISRRAAIDAVMDEFRRIPTSAIRAKTRIEALPSAQPDVPDTNVGDMVSRAAAIDILDAYQVMVENGEENPYAWARLRMSELPPAQPEKRTEERTETHVCDLISRQAAIDAILAVTGNSSVRELYEHVQEHELSDMWSGGVNAAIDIIIAVPSAQQEHAREENK